MLKLIITPCLVTFAAASILIGRAADTSIVDLKNDTGSPAHLASGILYGIPDTPDQIPDHFYTDIGFNYNRAGGSQLAAPGRGWIWGLTEYKNRFKSALSSYRTTRKYKAKFIIILPGLWGADSTQSSRAAFPGDNGNWTSWDSFLAQWITDIDANEATAGLSVDIWNEPDLPRLFWNRPREQYLQLWGRTYHRLKRTWPSVKLIGPAFSAQPNVSNIWWTSFMEFVKSNSSIPDEWVWHMETGRGDMGGAYGSLIALLRTYGLPTKPINIDEYATFREQVPSGSAWWISQLERFNAVGLRGNWLSRLALHDLLASLLSKPTAGTPNYNHNGGGYYPNGDYQVYKYYNLNMTGHRVGTSASDDGKIDTYATVGPSMVRILTGVRLATGTWQVTVKGLSSVRLPTSGTLRIHTWGFPNTGGHYGRVDAPNDLGWYGHPYTNDAVTFPIRQTDNATAYAFEFHVG